MSDFTSILIFFILPIILAYLARIKTEKGVCARVQSCQQPHTSEAPPPNLSVLTPPNSGMSACEDAKKSVPLPEEDVAPIISKEERADIIKALVKYGVRKSTAETLIEQSLQAGCNNREDCFVWCMQNMK